MFAVVNIGGFQEMVKQGDTLTVPLMEGEAKKKITLSDVMMISKDNGEVTFGAPFVKGASVELTILSHGRDKKIRVFKMRRRKRYARTLGHKQHHTKVEVTNISL